MLYVPGMRYFFGSLDQPNKIILINILFIHLFFYFDLHLSCFTLGCKSTGALRGELKLLIFQERNSLILRGTGGACIFLLGRENTWPYQLIYMYNTHVLLFQ